MVKYKLILNIFENNLKIIKKNDYILINIYGDINMFKLTFLKKNIIFYDQSTNNLVVELLDLNNFTNLISSLINNLLFNFNRLWYVKIKFGGKGYKIKRRKRRKSIKFYFYYSHINVIVLKNAKLKQRKKNKFTIKTWSKNNLSITTKKILKIKKLNIFTKRGLRSSKQVVFKKTGKKSNY